MSIRKKVRSQMVSKIPTKENIVNHSRETIVTLSPWPTLTKKRDHASCMALNWNKLVF